MLSSAKSSEHGYPWDAIADEISDGRHEWEW